MIILYLAIICIAGAGVARLVLPDGPRWLLHNSLLLSLGAGLGLAIASSLYFLCLAIAGPNIAVLIAVEAIVLLGLLALGILAKQRGTELAWAPGPDTPAYLTATLLFAAAVAVTMFTFYTLLKPHGEFDAWSIWNLRARFLYRGGVFWKDAFSTQIAWSHPGYPLMLPGLVALCWTLAGSESMAAPVGVAFAFTFAAAGVLITAIGILQGKTQAMIAGILLLGTFSFLEVGSFQYADVPLSFYMLSSLALLCLQDRDPDNPRYAILAGIMAGFAAWTKNEGLLFVLVFLVARAIAIFRYSDRSRLPRQFLSLAAGLLPPLALVAFFKLRFAPADTLFLGPIGPRLMDVSRWVTALVGFVKMTLSFGGFLLPVALLLILYWYLVRFQVTARDQAPLATILLTLALMLAGDFAAYLVSAGDVAQEMNSSLERVFIQLWPSGLLAFFLAANTPQLATQQQLEKRKASKHRRKGQ